jgi:hypothetical protein
VGGSRASEVGGFERLISDAEGVLVARLRALSLRMMKSRSGERVMIYTEPRVGSLRGKWMTKAEYAGKVFSVGGYAEFVFVPDTEAYSAG